EVLGGRGVGAAEAEGGDQARVVAHEQVDEVVGRRLRMLFCRNSRFPGRDVHRVVGGVLGETALAVALAPELATAVAEPVAIPQATKALATPGCPPTPPASPPPASSPLAPPRTLPEASSASTSQPPGRGQPLRASTATPSTGVISSVAPEGSRSRTVFTSLPVCTPIQVTGASSATPNSP